MHYIVYNYTIYPPYHSVHPNHQVCTVQIKTNWRIVSPLALFHYNKIMGWLFCDLKITEWKKDSSNHRSSWLLYFKAEVLPCLDLVGFNFMSFCTAPMLVLSVVFMPLFPASWWGSCHIMLSTPWLRELHLWKLDCKITSPAGLRQITRTYCPKMHKHRKIHHLKLLLMWHAAMETSQLAACGAYVSLSFGGHLTEVEELTLRRSSLAEPTRCLSTSGPPAERPSLNHRFIFLTTGGATSHADISQHCRSRLCQ